MTKIESTSKSGKKQLFFMRRTGKKRLFLILVLLWGFSPVLRAEIRLSGRISLERDFSHGGDEAFVRALLLQTENFARMEEAPRPDAELHLRIRAKEFRLVTERGKRILEIPGDSACWQKEEKLRGKLFFFLLCRRFAFAPEELEKIPAMEETPFWLTAAADQAMASAAAEGVYFRANRDMGTLRVLMLETGGLPAFGVLTAMTPELCGATESRCIHEEAWLLAEIFCRRKMMKDYLADVISGAPWDHWLRRFDSPAAAQETLLPEARALLWNRQAPLPAAESEKMFHSLETVPLLVTDKSGKKDLKTFPVAEAASRMSNDDPERLTLRRELVKRCRAFSRQASPPVCRAASQLAIAAENLGPQEERIGAYMSRLRELRETIRREREKERFFQEKAREVMPLIPLWQERFQALSPGDAAMSETVEQFLNETAEKYLSDF